ncbi:hypothetical protein HDV06_007115 [Boothiomyces sp. JEL0866]|nr:hypothetical protein HDV06_007115 [Boothiomyces sp. JEL0866]
MIKEKEDLILKSVLLSVDSLVDIQRAPFKPPSIPPYIRDKLYRILVEQEDWQHDKKSTIKRLLQLNRQAFEKNRPNTKLRELKIKKPNFIKVDGKQVFKKMGVDLFKWMDEQESDEEPDKEEEQVIPRNLFKESNQVKKKTPEKKTLEKPKDGIPTVQSQETAERDSENPERKDRASVKQSEDGNKKINRVEIETPSKRVGFVTPTKTSRRNLNPPKGAATRLAHKMELPVEKEIDLSKDNVNKTPKRIPKLTAESPVSVKKTRLF